MLLHGLHLVGAVGQFCAAVGVQRSPFCLPHRLRVLAIRPQLSLQVVFTLVFLPQAMLHTHNHAIALSGKWPQSAKCETPSHT